MNYTRIYASIVLRAQSERSERLALKKQGKYFEDHHIVPRSLGGRDVIQNMALLTGREHFICHWLLVKIYPVNSDEREKMLYALWRMSSKNEFHVGRYVNSHIYEYYRTEFAKQVSQRISSVQTGENNSQYGTHWYTNCYTGETIRTRDQLIYPWYKGKNLFRGESRKIKYWNASTPYRHSVAKRNQTRKRIRKDVHGNSYIERTSFEIMQESICKAKRWWDVFHAGNYKNLAEFGKTVNRSKTSIYQLFNSYIPAFSSDRTHRRRRFCSNIDLVGKYE